MTTIIKAGPDDKIYPVVKVATIVKLLVAEGISLTDALVGVHISKSALSSPKTRVSINQVIECYRNAAKLSCNPRFAYQAGLRFRISTYGMYGFAILSSPNFRQTIKFALMYHQLATPTADISYEEVGDLAVWTITPIPHPRIDVPLYKFLVELQFGVHMSLHRDVMGPAFVPRALHVKYTPPADAKTYPEAFGCEVLFSQSENMFVFDAACLESAPMFGNEINYLMSITLCDELMEDMQLRIGLAGKVREQLLDNLMRPTNFNVISKRLQKTTRTLRRKLREENTSYRKLVDELRMQVAIKYLRDTNLTIEDIAFAEGFNDTGKFRRAFRRWTNTAPLEFRENLQGHTRNMSHPG